MDHLLIVISTFPSKELVRQIGTQLIEKQLVACVNCVPGVLSIYEWKGEICEEEEVYAVMKVRSSLYNKLESELLRIHPYETPAVIGIRADQVADGFMQWILSKSLDSEGETEYRY